MKWYSKKERHNILRVAVLQRVCPTYRLHVFKQMSLTSGVKIRLFIGEDLPRSKVRNAKDISEIDFIQLPTQHVRVGRRILTYHRGILRELLHYRPDVILAEGESNILSYVKAVIYKSLRPKTALVHWSLGGIPGTRMKKNGIKGKVTNILRGFSDAFVVYSTYGKKVLLENGFENERIFVAVNVCDVSRYAFLSAQVSRQEARRALGVENKFVVLFVGSLTREKRIDLVLDSAECLDPDRYLFLIVGDGELSSWIKEEISSRKLHNVRMIGRITKGIESYYTSADVVVLPGRGGMIISEAMAFGKPVIVYQADGTEYDLVIHGETGLRLEVGTPEELARRLESVASSPQNLALLGARARERVLKDFNSENMVKRILEAISYAHKTRTKRLGVPPYCHVI